MLSRYLESCILVYNSSLVSQYKMLQVEQIINKL